MPVRHHELIQKACVKAVVPHRSSDAKAASLISDQPGASVMNVKTIAHQVYERPAVPAPSHSADRLTERWRLSDFLALTKAARDAARCLHRARWIESAPWPASIRCRPLSRFLHRRRGRSRRRTQHVVRRRHRCGHGPHRDAANSPRQGFEGRGACLRLVLGAIAVAILALATNLTAAALLAGTILFYVVVYTAWLKRLTRQNIVIGGAAGALPPVIGWAAATGESGSSRFAVPHHLPLDAAPFLGAGA